MASSTLPAPASPPRVIFAGDRALAVEVLNYLQDRDVRIVALLTPPESEGSHTKALRDRCPNVPEEAIMTGTTFRSSASIDTLTKLNPDFLLSIHFPYLVPEAVLSIPRVAPLNLHPAYLPYNRGWHTPSWALLEGTPIGATLHVITDELDSGPIVCREEISVGPNDTAHTLYQRILSVEFEIFSEAWPRLERGEATTTVADTEGTQHAKSDLHTPEIQQIDLDESVRAGRLIDRLRALTTNRPEEAAYFVRNGQKYRIQVSITPDCG